MNHRYVLVGAEGLGRTGSTHSTVEITAPGRAPCNSGRSGKWSAQEVAQPLGVLNVLKPMPGGRPVH
jgi:hypothetical protein